MKILTLRTVLFVASLMVAGCAAQPMMSHDSGGLQIGSATSKNLSFDSSQFANRVVKLRIRNSSGDDGLSLDRLRGVIEAGLRSAGYQIGNADFGIVLDVNAYQVQSAYQTNIRNSNGLGILLGGVAGYEMTKRPGGMSLGGGTILGMVAGAAIEDVIRTAGQKFTIIALCEVNIGIVRKDYKKNDRLVIGGNRIEHREPDEADTFTNFAMRDTVNIAAYGGDQPSRQYQTLQAVTDRLGRVIANLL